MDQYPVTVHHTSDQSPTRAPSAYSFCVPLSGPVILRAHLHQHCVSDRGDPGATIRGLLLAECPDLVAQTFQDHNIEPFSKIDCVLLRLLWFKDDVWQESFCFAWRLLASSWYNLESGRVWGPRWGWPSRWPLAGYYSQIWDQIPQSLSTTLHYTHCSPEGTKKACVELH